MGTPVEVLQQRMQHVAYRELWDLRNEITTNTSAPAGSKELRSYQSVFATDFRGVTFWFSRKKLSAS